MKRRIFSLAMAIIMALSLLPTTAFASVLGGGNVDGTTLADDMGGAAQTIFKTVLQSAAFETSAGLKIGTGDGTTTISGVNWKDEWFLSESLFYNHELARTAMALSAAAYVGANNMKSAYNAFGFDTRDSRFFAEYPVATKEDNDVVGHSFAIKEIYDPTIEDSRPLVVITVRGTPGNEEWYSNFNLGTEQYHDGFFTAEAKVLDNLNEYIEKMEELGYDMDSAKYLVTGHSRGAAVANILAASLTENSCAAQGDVFGYTFAAPAVAAYASENGYENIFNIVNPEDFVTQMPLGEGKWGYKRFGIDLVLPSRSYYAGYDNVYSKMALAYKDIIGKDFVPYQDGVQPVSKLTESIYNLDPTVNDFYTKKYPALYGDLITRFTCYEYFNMLADIIVTGNVNMKFVETVSHGAFDDITWFFISNYAIDNKVFSAHSQVAYLSWLRSCPAW